VSAVTFRCKEVAGQFAWGSCLFDDLALSCVGAHGNYGSDGAARWRTCGAAFMVLARLDRLAKQLEAVNADIKAELAPNELRAREILSEWREARQEAAKEARQFWIFWGIVAVLVVGWTIMRHYPVRVSQRSYMVTIARILLREMTESDIGTTPVE
jgi:hypothetical protein